MSITVSASWSQTISSGPFVPPAPWPEDRPDTYDEDLFWSEILGAWIPDMTFLPDGGEGGAGRPSDFALCGGVAAGSQQALIVVGSDDSDYVKVYFGSV